MYETADIYGLLIEMLSIDTGRVSCPVFCSRI